MIEMLVLMIAQPNLQLGVEVGPYRPAIDSEFDSATPFEDLFGDKQAIMVRFRAGLMFDQPFGKIGASVSGGWAQSTVKALTEKGDRGERSGGDTSYRLYPVSALMHLRGDALADLIPVPLIPFGAVGLNYTFWRITSGDGNTARTRGRARRRRIAGMGSDARRGASPRPHRSPQRKGAAADVRPHRRRADLPRAVPADVRARPFARRGSDLVRRPRGLVLSALSCRRLVVKKKGDDVVESLRKGLSQVSSVFKDQRAPEAKLLEKRDRSAATSACIAWRTTTVIFGLAMMNMLMVLMASGRLSARR